MYIHMQGTIGFGLCERFGELRKYNLRQLQDQARAGGSAGGGKAQEKVEEGGDQKEWPGVEGDGGGGEGGSAAEAAAE